MWYDGESSISFFDAPIPARSQGTTVTTYIVKLSPALTAPRQHEQIFLVSLLASQASSLIRRYFLFKQMVKIQAALILSPSRSARRHRSQWIAGFDISLSSATNDLHPSQEVGRSKTPRTRLSVWMQ